MNTDSFWDFPHSAKYDEIREDRHMHLLWGALADPLTGIDKVDRETYILFGENEALLIRPKSLSVWVGLELYRAFLAVMSSTLQGEW